MKKKNSTLYKKANSYLVELQNLIEFVLGGVKELVNKNSITTLSRCCK